MIGHIRKKASAFDFCRNVNPQRIQDGGKDILIVYRLSHRFSNRRIPWQHNDERDAGHLFIEGLPMPEAAAFEELAHAAREVEAAPAGEAK